MITFSIDDSLIDVFPHPDKAGKFLPDYYKKLAVNMGNHPEKDGTAKKCVPFMDAITNGYIIPLWSDIYITAKDGEIDITFPQFFPSNNTIGTHNYNQLKNHPAKDDMYGKTILKFLNPWVIKTPPGVSCLFTTPMNHFETRIKLVDGIVDTDTYYNNVNFPFLWNGGDGEFLIEKGTPLAQVIPFVRYDFNKFNVKPLDHDKFGKVNRTLGTTLGYGYRKYFWHKRKK